jgi:hypothetical protein
MIKINFLNDFCDEVPSFHLESILSTFHIPPMDSVAGTVMIAGKTIGTGTIMFPMGRNPLDIIDRTELGA